MNTTTKVDRIQAYLVGRGVTFIDTKAWLMAGTPGDFDIHHFVGAIATDSQIDELYEMIAKGAQ